MALRRSEKDIAFEGERRRRCYYCCSSCVCECGCLSPSQTHLATKRDEKERKRERDRERESFFVLLLGERVGWGVDLVCPE
jgi:hypothetical protein